MLPRRPIHVLDLFPGERAALLDLLTSFSDPEWASPTACAGWSVKDVALHLLADDVARLSGGRDGFANPSFGGDDLDLSTFSGLVAAMDRQNASWVEGTGRLSPRLLCELLRFTGDATDAYFRGLDLLAIGMPVDWAGPDPAPVWLDLAREYSERWVHQQHIREVVGQPGLRERRWFAPVLNTLVLGVPRALGRAVAEDGAEVGLTIRGEAGGTWRIRRQRGAWTVEEVSAADPVATVEMDQDVAWQVFTAGISPDHARRLVRLAGDSALTERVLRTVSVLAEPDARIVPWLGTDRPRSG